MASSSSTSSSTASSVQPPPSPPASSPPPATTSSVLTTTTSTTPATPTSTPSPAQSSTDAGRTSVASPTSSPSPSTSTPSSTSTSSFTSQVPTTLYSTNSAGSVVFVTTTIPEVFTTSVSGPSSGGSSGTSHTGVIVGAVVGGVVGIALLIFLLLCIRRRVSNDEFDGNFDPDRVVGHTDVGGATLPHVDLADEVTPFPQPYADQASSSMRQYSDSPYVALPSSLAQNGQTSPRFYPSDASGPGTPSVDAPSRQFMHPPAAYVPPINLYDAGHEGWQSARTRASPPPSSTSHNTSSARAAKEREATGRSVQGHGLGLATAQGSENNSDVVVHQDAGRAPVEDHLPPKEIPPAYESIPQD